MDVADTIVFFGSARIQSPEKATERLEGAERALKEGEGAKDALAEALKEAELGVRFSKYYTAARELAGRMTQWSKSLENHKHRFIVCSGGGPGIMEAANRGASEAEGYSIGLNISLPFEQVPNPYQTRELCFEFHYFFIRKFWFVYLAKAMAVFPGGFGTMDELFELLTLTQTGKTAKRVPIVLFGSEFWNRVFNFDALVEWGMISPRDLSLFKIFDDVNAAFEYLKGELTREYLQ
jgi:uncharacterized protein (TIGR00730 family)